jgi:hypothetical protein
MQRQKITTTISRELWELARKAKIPLSHACEIGLRQLLHHPDKPAYGETFEAPPENKAKTIQVSMQHCIDELNNKLEAKQ